MFIAKNLEGAELFPFLEESSGKRTIPSVAFTPEIKKLLRSPLRKEKSLLRKKRKGKVKRNFLGKFFHEEKKIFWLLREMPKSRHAKVCHQFLRLNLGLRHTQKKIEKIIFNSGLISKFNYVHNLLYLYFSILRFVFSKTNFWFQSEKMYGTLSFLQ